MNESKGNLEQIKSWTIGVVGAGTMGTCITADLLFRGLRVVLVDLEEEILEKSRAEIEKVVKFAPLLAPKLKALAPNASLDRVTFTTDLNQMAEVDFVIENITENWEAKEKLYRELDALLPLETCIGVDTSCISIAKLGALTERPSQIVGVHYMNPAYLVETVEVIRSPQTSQNCLDKLLALLELSAKQAVVVQDAPGFVSNRISHLFMNEAAHTLASGIASAKDIDTIFKQCFGHKMGPLETADLIGLDTVMYSLEVLYDSYGEEKYRPAPILREKVGEGKLGRKAGEGFYNYGTGKIL